ncbi:MAG: hypothetical protein DI538_06470 [Azospira oryzae]|nr:MAG: hypothetical protein DI538_06470 [Azospira oryzae]
MRLFALLFAFIFLATTSDAIPVPEKAEYGIEEVTAVMAGAHVEISKPRPVLKTVQNCIPLRPRLDGKGFNYLRTCCVHHNILYLEHHSLLI